MANYRCAVRTNYFHVKDEKRFKALMDRVYGEYEIEVWEKTSDDGGKVFGFGTYSSAYGVRDTAWDEDDDWEEEAYDEFVDELQKCVADNDAIIIFEVGNEKLRYLIGSALIITRKTTKYINLEDIAIHEAALLIGACWDTQCTY